MPDAEEIANCSSWLAAEFALLRPQLIVPVGKLAIAQFLAVDSLKDIIGRVHHVSYRSYSVDCIPLPHPSGASTWHRTEPGQTLLQQALRELGRHPALTGKEP